MAPRLTVRLTHMIGVSMRGTVVSRQEVLEIHVAE